jgi:hypothetical protein
MTPGVEVRFRPAQWNHLSKHLFPGDRDEHRAALLGTTECQRRGSRRPGAVATGIGRRHLARQWGPHRPSGSFRASVILVGVCAGGAGFGGSPGV